MYIYDYNLQFFFSYRNYLFGQNFKILIQTYRTLFKFSLLNAQTEHNIISALLGPSANTVWRACPVFQNVRWRFFVVNDTFNQCITKPSIFALRACFTETLSIWLCQCSALQEKQNQNKNSDNFRQKRKSPEKIKAICTTKSSFLNRRIKKKESWIEYR